MFFYYLFVVVGVAYAIYLSILLALPRFFFVPPQEWRELIEKVLDFPKPIYLKAGWKRLAYRRRLILALKQPAYYTNYLNNRLKIFPGDKEDKHDFKREMTRRVADDPKRRMIYGFFHPYANNGGGGERVLWQAVKATLMADDKNICAIYIYSDAKPLEIFANVREKFGINVEEARCVFIYLRRFPKYIEDWLYFTLAGQLIGSFLLGFEALFELTPDVWVDTQGLPGNYMLIGSKLKIPIVAYVHYPVIQDDMFAKLRVKLLSSMAQNPLDFRGNFKFLYWLVLYYTYMVLGALVEMVFCNGTFTYNHIKLIWRLNSSLTMEIMYPPCGDMTVLEKPEPVKENSMIYVGQFRPEKRQDLVLREYHRFLEMSKKSLKPLQIPKLVFLGLCRTPSDTATLDALKKLSDELELSLNEVEFVVGCKYDELLQRVALAKFGLNAMWNEHFGIGVVEYIQGGAVPIVHASGGPFYDICEDASLLEKPLWRNSKGYFFKLEQDPDALGQKYPTLSELFTQIFVLDPQGSNDSVLDEMRKSGRADLIKFGDAEFIQKWVKHTNSIDSREKEYRATRGDMEMVY